MEDFQLRKELIETCVAMNASGINKGTSGNISVRISERRFLVTPSGIPYHDMDPGQIVDMDIGGNYEGDWKPSSEWRMHADIYAAKADAKAVLHCHAPHATALSCLRKDLPAFHYMIGITGSDIIRCAKYELFGTAALSNAMMEAFGAGNTCLLANHGFTCFSKDLSSVLKLGIEVENLCQQYMIACSVDKPTILTKKQMQDALEAFKTYGNQPLVKSIVD